MTLADEKTIRAASSASRVISVQRFKKGAKDGAGAKFYKVASGYLMNFSINEGAAWKYYFRGLAGREDIGKAEAIRGMAAILVRMAAYRPMMTAFGVFLAYMGLSDNDDEDMEDVWEEFKRDLLGSFLTITIQGTQGGWQREPTSQLIEAINAASHGRKYDSWEHGMMFRLFTERDIDALKRGDLKPLLKITGPASAISKDLEFVLKQMDEDDFFIELLLFSLAYTNSLPFYRDWVNKRKRELWEKRKRKKSK